MIHPPILLTATNKITIMANAILRRGWLRLVFALVLLALPLTILAQGGDTPHPAPVILTNSQDKYPLGLHLELLQDPTGQLTIEDVSSPAYDDQFTPSQAEIPNFGYTSDAIWARFEVRNETGNATTWQLALADARPETVDLYLPAEDGKGWKHQQAGRSRPFTVREVPYRYGVFNLPLPQPQTVYLRFQGATNYLLPLIIWSSQAFSRYAQTELLLFGLFYGAMLVMMGYNFFLFASLRDRSHLYLVLLIASFTLNDAFREGLAQQYLWPAWPNLYGIEITATVNGVLLLLFGTSFLQTKTRAPRLHKIMMAMIPGFLLTFFYYLLGGSGTFHAVLALLTLILLLVTGYMTWRQGYRPARYYLLAWLILLGTVIFHTLIGVGLLPGTPFSQQGVRVSEALMVVLLSLALADRINLLKAETAKANIDLTKEIQERKVAQHAQSESEKKYRTVVEQAAEGILVIQDGRRDYYNPAWLQMTGYSAKEYDSIPFLVLVHPDDLETVKAAHQKLETKPGPSAFPDFRFTDKSGEIKWLSARGVRIQWEGKPAGMVFVQDITARKQAEESLQERKERYRLALETGQIALWQMDPATDQWELDGAVEQITGYTAGELGTEVTWEEATHPEDLPRIAAAWQSIFEGRLEQYDIIHRMVHKDGSVRWVEAQGTSIRNEAGQVIRLLGTSRDITATIQAEQLTAKRTTELVETNQNLQHEIAERRKIEAALLVAQSQLEQRVAERTAELEQANRQLTALLQTMEERVAERTRELTTFFDLTMLVSESRSLTNILETAIARILEVSQCQAICLHLPDKEQTCLALFMQRGLFTEQQQQLKYLPLEGLLTNWLADHHEPVLLYMNRADSSLFPQFQLDGFQSYLGVQLRVHDQIQGLLSYYRQSDPQFSLDEISLLAALADQLAIVIENHRLRGDIEEIAIVAERQRLARDLHDSITQSLYSLHLFAHAGQEAAEDGDIDRLDDNMASVKAISLSALKEMRLLLYQLQPEILAEKGLAEALNIRFDSVERRLNIKVDYQVEDQPALPDQVAEALYRAAIEVLNNSLKHATASQLSVCLNTSDSTVRLEIVDNGQGFDPTRANSGMGLKNVRQRMEQIGGRLEILSAPGAGTQVALTCNSNLSGEI